MPAISLHEKILQNILVNTTLLHRQQNYPQFTNIAAVIFYYMKEKNFWITTSLSWIVIIAILSLLPERDIKHISWFFFPGMDKVLHGLFYCIFAVFLANSLASLGMSRLWKTRLITVFVCAVYGGLIELIQPLTGRSKDIFDLLADMIGASVGALIYLQIRYMNKKWLR